jgi:hypothetical protein
VAFADYAVRISMETISLLVKTRFATTVKIGMHRWLKRELTTNTPTSKSPAKSDAE